MVFDRSSSVLFAMTFVLLAAGAAGGQETDPATAEKIAAKEKELGRADEALTRARIALQDRYLAIEAVYQRVAGGQTDDAARDLARVLDDLVRDARSQKKGADGKKRAIRAFAKGVETSVAKVEHELTRTVRPLVVQAANAVFEESVDLLDQFDTAAFAATVLRRVFPADRPFHAFWNEGAVDLVDESAAFREAVKEKKRIADEIAVLRDPKHAFTIGAPAGMCRVPKGTISIEATEGFKRKKRSARVADFYIDLHEVSHGAYWSKFWVDLADKEKKLEFLPRIKDESGKDRNLWLSNPETGEWEPRADQMNLPVTGIDFAAAAAYAASQGKRLPTEAEWLAAAAFEPGKYGDYPFGEKYVEGAVNDRNAKLGAPSPVDSHRNGRSAWGVFHLSGNVKEWIATTVEGADFTDLPQGAQVCLRGGSFDSNEAGVGLKWRWEVPAVGTRAADIGFRCAKNVE